MSTPQRPVGFKRLLKLAVRPRAVEQDVDEELRFHLEMRAATLERDGLSPAEAQVAAEREFGDVSRVREECVRIGHEREREMKRSLLWDALVQDVRYAVAEFVGERSGQVLKVEEGALYPALHRLEKKGLLEAEWGLSENNRRAKFYRLTTEGRVQLRAETQAWKRYSAAVSRVLEAL